MAKIVGGTASTSMLIPDWKQTNPNRADYIKNKPFDKIDTDLDANSTNPVQNKVVTAAIGDMEAAMDIIIAEQEAIIAMQNALIGGDGV